MPAKYGFRQSVCLAECGANEKMVNTKLPSDFSSSCTVITGLPKNGENFFLRLAEVAVCPPKFVR
jgi:hypothetical protein